MVTIARGVGTTRQTKNNRPSNADLADCIACGASRGGNLQHLVVCGALKQQHEWISNIFQSSQRDMPADGWQLASLLFCDDGDLLEERVAYGFYLTKRLETIAKALV